MTVQIATLDDIDGWLDLAREVEYLFGPMLNEPGFLDALRKNIDRRSAFCTRRNDGEPGAPLTGGLLWSAKPPVYRIGWLSVAEQTRRQGVGSQLVGHVLDIVRVPAEIHVVTFGEDIPDGRPARRFYERLGFEPFEKTDRGPEGGTREIFRMVLP